MNKKRIIIISITVLLLILVGLLVYNIFFKSDPEIVSDNFFESPEDILADNPELNEESRLLRLTNKSVASFNALGENITTVFRDGSIADISLSNGVEESITNIGSDVVTANISPQGDLIALQIDDEDVHGRWLIFNRNDGNLESLNRDVRGVDFSPQGKVLIIREGLDDHSLTIRDGGKETTISNIAIPDLTASWLDEETIKLSMKPSGLAPSILYLLDVKTSRLTRILGTSFGLTSSISPKEDWMLLSRTSENGRGSIFKIKSLEENSEKILNISSIPEKCVFSQDTRYVFCGSFENSISNSIMPDDYYKGIFSSSINTISKVNLELGLIEKIEKVSLDLINLQLSSNEDILFFIDKNTKQLYRFKI